MLFPLRHNRRLRSSPWLTMLLIAINGLVFAGSFGASQQAELLPTDPLCKYYLWPVGEGFQWWQLFSSAFLHADMWHLGGNMLFLWIFGGAVEDRFGKLGFLAFYAAGAAAAGGLYLATGPTDPMLGASGAISAVSGAFLVLFPQVRIQIVYLLFFVGTFEISAMWVLLFYFAKDGVFFLLTHNQADAGVAYVAHIGGFVLGFAVAAGLLATKLLARETEWDLLAMIQHWRRRQAFKRVAASTPVWRHDTAPLQAGAKGKQKANADLNMPPLVLAQREGIFYFVAHAQMQEAAAAYGALLKDHPGQVLPEQTQHDLAALLMKNGAHAESAQAFRLLLKHYPKRPDRAQTQLLLALLCQKYLGQQAEAQQLLKDALPKLEGAEKKMAENMLAAA